nr:hypothetical protein GCM10020093_089370 [Planobispora longispora]
MDHHDGPGRGDLRRRDGPAPAPLPRFLVWLGLISYSVYLLHHPLLRLTHAVLGDARTMGAVAQAGLVAGFVAAVLGLSWLTYRYVELPMQRLGRRLARRAAPVKEPA